MMKAHRLFGSTQKRAPKPGLHTSNTEIHGSGCFNARDLAGGRDS
jgi:hypothetical protein